MPGSISFRPLPSRVLELEGPFGDVITYRVAGDVLATRAEALELNWHECDAFVTERWILPLGRAELGSWCVVKRPSWAPRAAWG